MTCAQVQIEEKAAGITPGDGVKAPSAPTSPDQQQQQVVGEDVGLVLIGRNEGDRLIRALEAGLEQVSDPANLVYVDSGSSDGSPQRAREMGVTVVDLDLSTPFTAARARNAGFEALVRERPMVQFVQFLDGDCELYPGWLAAGRRTLLADDRLAVAAGRRREKFPDRTIYNKLCDLEWRTKVGKTTIIGGDSMIRRTAFEEAGGYDTTIIAGEEPELCIRLREKGWTVYNDAAWMSSHDADMTRFRQWWKRAYRFGHAAIEVSQKHKSSPTRIYARDTVSTFAWTLGPPLLTLILVVTLALTLGGWWWMLGLLPLGLYPLLVAKVTLRQMRRERDDLPTALLYGSSVTLAKFPQVLGMIRFLRNRRAGRREKIIEYK